MVLFACDPLKPLQLLFGKLGDNPELPQDVGVDLAENLEPRVASLGDRLRAVSWETPEARTKFLTEKAWRIRDKNGIFSEKDSFDLVLHWKKERHTRIHGHSRIVNIQHFHRLASPAMNYHRFLVDLFAEFHLYISKSLPAFRMHGL